MNVFADVRDPSEIQSAASPGNPDLVSQVGTARDRQSSSGAASLAPHYKPGSEEPNMALESDVPSDGRDAVGEAMIRDLPQLPELSEPPSQPDPSSQAT